MGVVVSCSYTFGHIAYLVGFKAYEFLRSCICITHPAISKKDLKFLKDFRSMVQSDKKFKEDYII